MRILAVDTATRTCSVAVCENDNLIAETNLFRRQTHSRHLLDMIHQTLSISGESLTSIDGFAVTRGPGSFTGLRIGLSCVKGLAYGLDKPVVSASSLQVLASQASAVGLADRSGLICTLLDARKKEVYFACFALRNGKLEKVGRESVLRPEKLEQHVDGRCLFIGDGAYLYQDSLKRIFKNLATFAPPQQNYIRAHSVAAVCFSGFFDGDNEREGLVSLVPRYIRRADAELAFK